MNLPFYIASKIYFTNDKKKKISAPAVKIATIGVAIGLAVMLISVSIITGFKNEIREKIAGFGAHLRITNLEQNSSFEMNPIKLDSSLIYDLKQIKGIKNINTFTTKPGIVKSNGLVQGVVIKGIGQDYDSSFIANNLIEGRFINIKDKKFEVLISTRIARAMKLKLNDEFITYFFQDNDIKIKLRKFAIVGIYNTNFVDFDKSFVFTNIDHINKLNSWKPNQIGGIEITINKFDKLEEIDNQVYDLIANRFDEEGSSLLLRNIKDLNPQIFGWLDLLDMNVWVILILMAAVAGFNMISGLLIIILEQTQFIGILKALGSTNWLIQKIFLAQSFFIIGKGLVIGNIIAFLLMFIQYYWKVISLNPEDYYIAHAPVNFNIMHILLINFGSLLLTLLIMLIPSILIRFISPSKAIKFE